MKNGVCLTVVVLNSICLGHVSIFFNCQIKFLCPLLYLIFLKKIAQQAGRRPSSRMPLFLFYFFIFHCVYFLLHLQYKKKLNHRMHTPPRRSCAPPPRRPSRPVRCSDHQLRGKNVFLQLRLPSLHPIPSKRVCG